MSAGHCRDIHTFVSFFFLQRPKGTYQLFKLGFEIKNVAGNKEGLFVMMKKPNSSEDITILKAHAPDNRASKREKQTWQN